MRKAKFFLILTLTVVVLASLVGCESIYRVKNSTPLETDVFADKPDEIVLQTHGEAISYASFDEDACFEGFAALMEKFVCAGTIKTRFSLSKVREYRKKSDGFQFRYEQRRKFTGSLKDEGNHFNWGEIYYDAILFICENDELIAIPYLDGEYRGVDDLFLVLFFEEGAAKSFVEGITSAKE